MGNQQERLEILSPDYLGGLIDGEGYFGLFVRGDKSARLGFLIGPCFSMAMADHGIIKAVHHSLDLYGLAHGYRVDEPRNLSRIHITGTKRMVPFCRWIIPYLRGVKIKGARNVLDYCLYRQSLPGKSPVTETDIEFLRKSRSLVTGKGGYWTRDIDKLSRILNDYTPCPTSVGEDIV